LFLAVLLARSSKGCGRDFEERDDGMSEDAAWISASCLVALRFFTVRHLLDQPEEGLRRVDTTTVPDESDLDCELAAAGPISNTL